LLQQNRNLYFNFMKINLNLDFQVYLFYLILVFLCEIYQVSHFSVTEEGVCILSLQPNELLETTVIQEEQQPKQSACSSPLDRKLESLSQESHDEKPARKRSRKNQTRSSAQLSYKSAMERQRRICQGNLLQALRRCIPDLIEDEGAPKVVILEEAIEVCKVLQKEEARLKRHLNELRQKQTELSQRLKETHSRVLSGDD